MLTVCAKSGIEFEASSARQKNHPAITELLSYAHKKGAYGAAVEALEAIKADGVTDMETAERILNAAIDGRRVELQAERDLWRARRDERKHQRSLELRGLAVSDYEHPDNITNAEQMSEPPARGFVDDDARYEG